MHTLDTNTNQINITMNKEEDLIQYIAETLKNDRVLLQNELDEFLEDKDRINYLRGRIATAEEMLNDLLSGESK